MSALERRLQILLDQERYSRLEAEAGRTGRSVAAVIREAIDYRFSSGQAARAAAGQRLLASSEVAGGVEPDWADTKQAMADDVRASVR